MIIRCVNRTDHLEKSLARARYTFRWENNLIKSRLDISGRQRCAVVKLDSLFNFEGVLGTTILTCRNIALTQITLEVSRIGRIVRIHSNQQAVERPNRVDHSKCRLSVSVVRRDLAADNKIQGSS